MQGPLIFTPTHIIIYSIYIYMEENQNKNIINVFPKSSNSSPEKGAEILGETREILVGQVEVLPETKILLKINGLEECILLGQKAYFQELCHVSFRVVPSLSPKKNHATRLF